MSAIIEFFLGSTHISNFLLFSLIIAFWTFLQHTKKQNETIEAERRNAQFDKLTQIRNREGFPKIFEPSLLAIDGCTKKNRRTDVKSVTVFAFDLDGFKAINDKYYHDAGDNILKVFAGIISRFVHDRMRECEARFGGDEFFLSLVNVSRERALEICAEIIEELAKVKLSDISQNSVDDGSFYVGVSIGVYCVTTREVLPSDVLSRADQCLAKAKRTGKGRAVYEVL